MNRINSLKKKVLVSDLIAIVFIALCAVFVLIKKDSVYMQIWDFLDSGVGQIKLMKDSNTFYQNESIVPMLGGISRDFLRPKLNIYAWLYMILPSYYAIIIGWIIKIIFSIFGMKYLGYTLLNNRTEKISNVFGFAGLLYGIAATQPTQSFGFSTLPFLLALLINIYRTNNYKYLIILIFYPLFSDMFLFGIFICGYILLFFIIDFIKNKKPKPILLLSILCLIIGYMIVYYNLINVLLFSNQKTIKNDGTSVEYNNSIISCLINSIDVFINGIDHANASSKYIIMPLTIAYIFYIFYNAYKNRKFSNLFKNSFIWIFIWIIFNCVVYGLDSYGPFRVLLSKCLPFLSEFSFARTVWFNPFLWCLSFSLILININKKTFIYALCTLAFVSILFSNTRYNNVGTNIKYTLGIENKIKGMETTYKDYYSTSLFNEIKKDINYNGEWSVAFGMHPSVIQYNGIHTLDGYISYYPLEYKQKFEKIIEPELLIDEKNYDYFNNWGGRAYIFSLETSYNTWKDEYKNEKANMYIDTEAFKELNGKYIFSRVEISNYKELNLKLVNIYSNNESSYTIYLYRC